MEQYITEKHPEKLDIYQTCAKLPLIKTDHYWCYMPAGSFAEDLYAEESSPFVGVFKKSQNGYKFATEKVPYPSEEELLEVVKELHVSGEDMAKTKWQLLAEAFTNAK